MHYLALFFCGMFLCNSVPHLVCGLQGKPFPTPFAKPRGIGFSSPLVNFLWGFANLVVALVLLGRHPFALTSAADAGSLLIGALLIGVFCSRHFGAVQATRGDRS
ncbi:MAG TPA: hypothetical protein VGG24_20035 [Paraburkholderia sp.]|jgi:hypothetical protein